MYFFAKRNTTTLFYMYQVFSSLQGQLHFFGHFSFTFMEHFFIDHPIFGSFLSFFMFFCFSNFGLFLYYIGCPKKRCSIKVKEKCTKKWRWPSRELKTWYMQNNIMVFRFTKKYFSYFDLYSWYGQLNV